MDDHRSERTTARLGVWDTASLIVGIVVGTAIFKSPMLVFQNVDGPTWGMAAWMLGGVLMFTGALCYAELATCYPRNGGDIEYLSRAFGRWLGFLFGWAHLVIVLPASIGAMAYTFADYFGQTASLPTGTTPWLAVASVAVMTALNAVGVVAGKVTQNLLSGAKVIGLAALIVAGLYAGLLLQATPESVGTAGSSAHFGLAMVFVLYAFGGWNDAVFVAAEVRDPQRNLPRALLAGLAGITLTYLAINAAYLAALGFEGVRHSPVPAAAVFERVVGSWGGRAISLLVATSALGAINGMVLTGSRVCARLGSEHRAMSWLKAWDRSGTAPVAALLAQALITSVLILAVGTELGRSRIDATLVATHLPPMPWATYYGGFETLVAASAPVFWTFFLGTGLAFFVLRIRDQTRPRPFQTPLYPITPMIFCATCLYMLYSSLTYAGTLAAFAFIPLLLGLPLAIFHRPAR